MTGIARIVATFCGLLSVLCAAVSAPIIVTWAIDASRPISVAPLLVSAALLISALVLFVVRRELLVRFTTRPSSR